MLHAVSAPVLRSVVLGGLGLGVALLAARAAHGVTHRLVLDTEVRADAIYLTAFDRGEVEVRFDRGELTPLSFEIRATLPDGCRWLAVEDLVPLDDHRFAYDYREHMLGCPEGTVPMFAPTPRTGIVTVAD